MPPTVRPAWALPVLRNRVLWPVSRTPWCPVRTTVSIEPGSPCRGRSLYLCALDNFRFLDAPAVTDRSQVQPMLPKNDFPAIPSIQNVCQISVFNRFCSVCISSDRISTEGWVVVVVLKHNKTPCQSIVTRTKTFRWIWFQIKSLANAFNLIHKISSIIVLQDGGPTLIGVYY